MPSVVATEVEGRDLEAITDGAVLTRGLGRSYGDASLPPPGRGPVARSTGADRVLAFDEATGTLHAQAGLTLDTLAGLFLPRGFFVPVTPGTRAVTLGGMVAADVHGKNHHVAGTLGRHVEAIGLRLPDGRIAQVRDEDDADLFRATLGGMGLTGHILDVTLKLEPVPSRAIVEHTSRLPDLESLIDALETAGETSPFTVAWSDFLAGGSARGRGVLLRGRWADPHEAKRVPGRGPSLTVPFEMPAWVLDDSVVRLFNAHRYGSAGTVSAVRDAERFFYPLDSLRDWNLLYGRRGFTQYQCVLPRDASMRSYLRLAETARSGGPGPFLAVIKDCGNQGKGLLSFPMPGISFALDFPVHDGTPDLVARLNEVTIEAGGRIYLAKDAFTTAAHYAEMDPRLGAFLAVKRRIDPDNRIESALSRRLGFTAPA